MGERAINVVAAWQKLDCTDTEIARLCDIAMEKLSAPDKELVSRILQEVGFEERLVGYQVRERSGTIEKSLYSFEEVINFFNDQFPFLKFEELTTWLNVVIKDEELARKVDEAVEEGQSDYERTRLIRDLMEERLVQCKNAGVASTTKGVLS